MLPNTFLQEEKEGHHDASTLFVTDSALLPLDRTFLKRTLIGGIMKKTSILFLAISVAFIGISSPLSAAEKPANYFAIKGGIYSPSDSYDLDHFNGGNKTELDSKTGFSGEVAIGHYFIPIFAIELGPDTSKARAHRWRRQAAQS